MAKIETIRVGDALPEADHTPTIVDLWGQLEEAKARRKAIEDEVGAFELILKKQIGDAESVVANGEVFATWKESKRKGYMVEPTSYRTLRITKEGRKAIEK